MSQYNVQGSTIGSVSVRPGETLLDACLRQGVALAFSCRGGTCHTCLMRCTAGTVPERAQRGLGAALQAKGYFLPCLCVPEGDLSVEPPLASDREVACRVDAVRRTAGQSVLVLEPASQIPLARGDAVALETGQPWACRANVVAVPEANYFLELALDASALAALRATYPCPVPALAATLHAPATHARREGREAGGLGLSSRGQGREVADRREGPAWHRAAPLPRRGPESGWEGR